DSSIKVFNGSIEFSINKRLLGNGYREVEVPNAINGSYWYLNATSDNAIASIETNPASIFNYPDIVYFNATFLNYTNDGTINLSIYSPSAINNRLNYTFTNSSFGAGLEVYFGDWNISETAIKYGIFRMQVKWNNETSAGFREGTIIINAETSLQILYPSQNVNYNASKIFDMTVYYNDTGQNLNISNANIQYKINNGSYSAINDSVVYVGKGKYDITFDCNSSEFNYGRNNITIKAGGTYYNNQTETLNLTIWGETNLTRLLPQITLFDSSETFNISLYFNDTVKAIGIINASIYDNIYVNGNQYIPYDYHDYGNGYYNITVNCNADVFNDSGYGYFNLSINVNKMHYYNQTTSFMIDITGDTELTLVKFPNKIFYYSDELFNITATFNDTSRNEGIGNATIEVDVDGGSYTPFWKEIGGGNYNITINCSDQIFRSYGYFNLRINISKANYYSQSDSSLDLIIGNTTLIINDPQDGSIFIDRQVFNITIQYDDVVNGTGIKGAIINYSLNEGGNYRGDNVTDIGDGKYNITIYANHTDFGPNNFGFINILINVSKQNYNNLSTTFNFHRQITTSVDPSNSADLGSVIRGLNVSYTFNYSDNENNFIIGASWGEVSPNYGFIPFLKDWSNGTYTMELETSSVNVAASPFTFTFNISAIGNETQVISLDIDVTIIQTKIETLLGNSLISRISGLNQTATFYFNDTVNNQPILDLTTGDIEVRNNETGVLWNTGDFNWSLINPLNDGNYILNISTNGLDAGWYVLKISASNSPNFDWSWDYLEFYLRGDYTQINMISVSDLEDQLTPTGSGYNYTTFLGSDLSLEFNITNLDNGANVTGAANQYIISYKNLVTLSEGIIPQTFNFNFQSASYGTYFGTANTSILMNPGYYLINITVIKLNYENSTFSFNLTLVNSQMNMVLLTNVGGILTPDGIYNSYNSSVAVDINLEFNITDTESLNRLIARNADSYTIWYQNLDTSDIGTLSETLGFNNPTSTYMGSILTSGLQTGNYLINVSVDILNYDIFSLIFNFTIVSTDVNIINITNPGGQLFPSGVGNFYESAIAVSIDIAFNTTDGIFGNVITIGTGRLYEVLFENLDTFSTGSITGTLNEGGIIHNGTLDTSQLGIGNYSITIIINKSNAVVSLFNFNLRIILTNSSIISISNPNGELIPSGIGNFYVNSIMTDLIIEFNSTDATFGNLITIGLGNSYTISYLNLGSLDSGTISNSLTEGGISHSGTLTTTSLESGNYTFTIIINKSNNIVSFLSFNLTIIFARSGLISVSDSDFLLTPIGNYYETYIETDIDIEFNITDFNFGNITLLGGGISYMIFYEDVDPLENGTIFHTLNEIALIHRGTLDISQLSSGNYSITITINKSNNVISLFSFNLSLIDKNLVRISIVHQPLSINAGETLKIIFLAEYFNGDDWVPLPNASLRIVPYFDGFMSTGSTWTTNFTGEVAFEITVGIKVTNITLTAEILSGYYYTTASRNVLDINVIPYSPGFALEDFLPYLIIIGAAVALVGGSIGVYRGVVVPKKREKARILNEVKT
ncbi:hypothetical protein LCGC14_1336060, partial [marine sediment metagenome]